MILPMENPVRIRQTCLFFLVTFISYHFVYSIASSAKSETGSGRGRTLSGLYSFADFADADPMTRKDTIKKISKSDPNRPLTKYEIDFLKATHNTTDEYPGPETIRRYLCGVDPYDEWILDALQAHIATWYLLKRGYLEGDSVYFKISEKGLTVIA
jgi:hypothetical protein